MISFDLRKEGHILLINWNESKCILLGLRVDTGISKCSVGITIGTHLAVSLHYRWAQIKIYIIINKNGNIEFKLQLRSIIIKLISDINVKTVDHCIRGDKSLGL